MPDFPQDVLDRTEEILTGKRETDSRGFLAALLVALSTADDHKHHMKRVKTAAEIRKFGPRVWSYCTKCKGYKFSKQEKGLTWG